MAGRHHDTLDDAASSIHAVASSSLTRVWIAGPGDLCATCSMAPECPDRSRCLHLERSLGLTTRVDGPFRRFPFGAREVGQVALALEPRILNEELAASGLADPAWLALHRIAGFGAWPLAASGRCLGVVAVFRREPIGGADAQSIATVVRLAAAALENLERATLPAVTIEAVPPAPRLHAPAAPEGRNPSLTPPPPTMADAQRSVILEALARAGGRVSGPGGAAELLAMRSTTLESRIRKLGLRKPPRTGALR